MIPDEVVDDERVPCSWAGCGWSSGTWDNSLVMLLPKDKLLFTVDFIPLETVQFRDMPDGYLPDWFDSLDRVIALPGWDQMVPGHPYAGGRFGTRDDVRNLKQYMTELSDAVKQAADQGKCFDTAIKEVKLPKYGAERATVGLAPSRRAVSGR